MDDWRMWRHEWFSLVIALNICIISRSAKRAIKGMFIPFYVSLITWKWKSNYFYSILEVFHQVLWKIKNRVMCPLIQLFIGNSLCERAKSNIFVKEKKNRKFRCVYMSNELISKIIWRTNFLFGCLFCFLYFLWIVGIILKYTLV